MKKGGKMGKSIFGVIVAMIATIGVKVDSVFAKTRGAPAAPTNFSMTALDTATIRCSWTDNSDNETHFFIFKKDSTTKVDSVGANVTVDTVTKAKFSELTENTQFIWVAAACSANVDTSWSNKDTCYTLIGPPTDAEFTQTANDSAKITLSVTEPPNSTADSTGSQFQCITDGGGGTSSGWLTGVYTYTDSGLNENTQYGYKVRFRNGDALGDTSYNPTEEKLYTLCGNPKGMTLIWSKPDSVKVACRRFTNDTQGKSDYFFKLNRAGTPVDSANSDDSVHVFHGVASSYAHVAYVYYLNGDSIRTTAYDSVAFTSALVPFFPHAPAFILFVVLICFVTIIYLRKRKALA
ncbi:MAG: fibronectin type III domain-containing protein [bacterium]|nr:fibronectin type III domain-containing protein [bacterium]